jgi:hypothetical protein
MKVGDYINIRGGKSQWFQREKGAPDYFPDYKAIIIELAPEDSIFYCTIMKTDGTLWNVYKKNIIGRV